MELKAPQLFFRGAKRVKKHFSGVKIGWNKFELNARHMMTFLDPLVVLTLTISFSLVLKLGSGSLSVQGSCIS